jgi:L-alanine-DL-glutamate epimerase-like enolase superfamily enzyme
MKITEILAHPMSVRHDRPVWTAHESMDRALLTLVEVRTDAGITGYGEIAGGPQPVIVDMVRAFADVASRMDPLGHAAV